MKKIKREFNTSPGVPLPLGVHIYKNGMRFALFSRHAASVNLILFETDARDSDFCEISLDPKFNKTGDIWHIWVGGIKEKQHYGYKIDGAFDPKNGHRFNRHRLLLDPYARAISNSFEWDLVRARGFNPDDTNWDESLSESDSTPFVPRSIVVASIEDSTDRPLNILQEELVIYELHVKGFTVHPSSGVKAGGTFAGLSEKIPYLKELGVNAVELMPIQEFDENENINVNPLTGERLKNYWGYSTLSFFAPKGGYASRFTDGGQVDEFRRMVKSFHEAGIEVILDVVYNHTAEGDRKGPTVCFKGIDNSIYYILEEDRRYYRNYSGCGNTFNCNHPFVREFILESLRYWVMEMHIDGFRFDLASILGRDRDGNILANPPLIEKIEQDPILRKTKIIAEAWDAAGAYQVGKFPGRWAEWNGKFRDDVRKFWHRHNNSAGDFATRISGSSDLYQNSGRGPDESINFVTCHDGFTLNDLVSFREKHNLANGENNRDGENNNYSDNFGSEGMEVTPFIDRIRKQQIKNFIATLFLSQGIPMLLAGDEFRRTQNGNNNSYCQDNAISWVDWALLERNRDLFRFTREIIRFRKEHPSLRRNRFFTGSAAEGYASADISWHGHRPFEPDWSPGSSTVCMLITGEYAKETHVTPDSDIYIVFNASHISRYYYLPGAPSGREWKVALDTSRKRESDIFESGSEEPLAGSRYFVKKLSTVVMTA